MAAATPANALEQLAEERIEGANVRTAVAWGRRDRAHRRANRAEAGQELGERTALQMLARHEVRLWGSLDTPQFSIKVVR